MFGSRARGDYRERSDIDLAIKGGKGDLFALDVDEQTSTLLMFDIVNMDKPVQSELLESIEKEGMVIYENTTLNNQYDFMKLQNISIAEIKDNKIKSQYTREVLESLPAWFGNKQSLNEYVKEVAEYPYWAAVNEANECLGFFSIKIHYGHTGDIFVCGINPEYHHMGIGKALYGKAEQYFIQMGCKYIIVKTLSDIVDYEPYAQSRRFYRSVGFEELLTLTEMWDESNPCLIMVKSLPIAGK